MKALGLLDECGLLICEVCFLIGLFSGHLAMKIIKKKDHFFLDFLKLELCLANWSLH